MGGLPRQARKLQGLGRGAARAKIRRGNLRREAIDQKGKRAGGPALFRSFILLPVGLADLMWGRYFAFTKPSTGKSAAVRKKGRTLRARPV